MKSRIFGAAILLTASSPVVAGEFDLHLKACHDAAWAMDDFKNVPNAGVSAYPGGYDDKEFYAYWIIDWDGLQVAGKCEMDLKSPTVKKISRFTS